jgi:hypothetical protein
MRTLAASIFALALGCTATLDLGPLDQGCPEGSKACDGECVLISDPAYGCGLEGCERCSISNGTTRCDADRGCVLDSCRAGFKACEGQCVSVTDPRYGCGRPGCNACYVHNGEASCDGLGDCSVAQCDFRWDDCNNDYLDGCETNLNSDQSNCGSCSTTCAPIPHAVVTCGGAACVIRVCAVGYADCNAAVYDGCEQDVAWDRRHCGGCGRQCPAGTQCQSGICQ